jgi:hypothetical protein
MTNLFRKALRIDHDHGLLGLAEVDERIGYRYYGTVRVGTAQMIRRFPDPGMGVPQVKEVLVAPDLERAAMPC